MLHYTCIGLAPFVEVKRIAGANKILKVVHAPIFLLSVSDHPKRWVQLGNMFARFAPPNQWKHTTQEVLAWFEAEGYEAVHRLNQMVGVRVPGLSRGFQCRLVRKA
jgi:hypothetical protein